MCTLKRSSLNVGICLASVFYAFGISARHGLERSRGGLDKASEDVYTLGRVVGTSLCLKQSSYIAVKCDVSLCFTKNS